MPEEKTSEISLKEEADKLMRIQGKTKGSEFLSIIAFIRQKYGEQKLHLVEKKMEELGYPIDFSKINPMEWYQESLNLLTMIVAKHLFGWKDLFELGYNAPKFSFGVKVFMKLISPRRVFDECSKTWQKFNDVGTLEPYEYNEKEKYAILHLKDYKFHLDICSFFSGFFLRILQYTQKSEKLSIKETKCMFKGDPYHEYIMRWE